MFAREFHPARFLRAVYATAPLRDYCAARGIPFDQAPAYTAAVLTRWATALATLPPDAQARVEFDLSRVNDLAGRDGNAHLEEASVGDVPPADVPGGPPLALWYLVHRPHVFTEVFFHHEVTGSPVWRTARAAPDLTCPDPARAAAVLGGEVRAFFRLYAGTGRFCAAEAHALPDGTAFAVRVADRVRLVEAFTDAGRPVPHRLRPARAVLFVYHPADGTVLLHAPLRAEDQVRALFRCFGRAVLDAPVECGGPAFDLDRLTRPFRPLPDAPDMEAVRVKALHLRYPARAGRRCLKLETLAGDGVAAVEELLRAHVGDAAADLTVSYAELQVRLRVDGRPRAVTVRLWGDRCNLNHTPLGRRLRVCLRRWELARD